jgi:hypothetical protein
MNFDEELVHLFVILKYPSYLSRTLELFIFWRPYHSNLTMDDLLRAMKKITKNC